MVALRLPEKGDGHRYPGKSTVGLRVPSGLYLTVSTLGSRGGSVRVGLWFLHMLMM
jgi:hypothetical protein